VTWTRVRAFLGGAASVLASREVLRRASDLAASEDRNRVTTMADGAFLVISRAAVQALLDDIVSSQHFLECPVSDGVSSAPARDCASGQTAASGGGLADASTGPPPQKASGGRCVASLSASDSDASDWSDASKPLSGTSTGSGRVHSPRSADGSPGGGGNPHCGVPSGVVGGGTGGGGTPPSAPGSGADGIPPVPSQPAVQLCFGMDKGGRQSTVKVYLGIAIQPRPSSVGNSIVLGVFPCKTDDDTALRSICAIWLADLEELRANGLNVRGERRRVRVILTGDYSQSPMVGHPCGAKWPGYRCAPIFHLRQSTGTAFFRFRWCGLQRVMGWGLGQWFSRSTEWMDEVVPTGVLLAALIAGK